LAARRAAPAEDQRVDAVGADGEDDHGHVTARGADGCAGDEEADRGDDFGDGDVPCALVEFSGGPGYGDGDDAGDQVGRACQDEGNGLRETESLDNGGEEVLEAVRGKVLKMPC
jgi:hypothetical protein